MLNIKLWLDDIRDPLDYDAVGWCWVKTAEEAIDALKTGEVILASLYHDLGNVIPGKKEVSGYDVVCWMEENNCWPRDGVRVHSMNPVGCERMLAVIENHYSRRSTTPFRKDGVCN